MFNYSLFYVSKSYKLQKEKKNELTNKGPCFYSINTFYFHSLKTRFCKLVPRLRIEETERIDDATISTQMRN